MDFSCFWRVFIDFIGLRHVIVSVLGKELVQNKTASRKLHVGPSKSFLGQFSESTDLTLQISYLCPQFCVKHLLQIVNGG